MNEASSVQQFPGLARLKRRKGASSPLYVQIAGLMRRRMRSGEWPAGMQLPTLDQLSTQFGVAKVTVRQAMGMLEAEQLIWRRQGIGTFVSANVSGKHWLSVATDWDELVRMIEGTESRLIQMVPTGPPPRLIEQDGILSKHYCFMQRLHSFSGESHLLLDLYLEQDVFDRAPSEFMSSPVIPVLNALPGLTLGRAHQTVTVGSADFQAAQHFRVDVGAPVVEVRRTIQDNAGLLIYFGHLHYRADTFRLEMVLRS